MTSVYAASRGEAAPGRSDLVRHHRRPSAQVRDELDAPARAFAAAAGFEPKAGRHLLLPDAGGRARGRAVRRSMPATSHGTASCPAALPGLLPGRHLSFRQCAARRAARRARLRRSAPTHSPATARSRTARVTLVVPDGVDGAELGRIVEAVTLARDLINTPSNDMGPAELEHAARTLATRHGATMRTVLGDDLLAENFPADPCGRPRLAARAAADRFDLGRPDASEGDAGRQGRVLRHRRARHQAVERHADHEEGHGRRGHRAGARPYGDGPQAARCGCAC